MARTLERIAARLLTTAAGGSGTYRLFVVGPAVLEPPADRFAPWLVRVTTTGSFLPRRRLRTPVGGRIAAALFEPRDLPLVSRRFRAAVTASAASGRRREFYGWALLYQLPGDVAVGRIDRSVEQPDLPAFYEEPLELADRQEFLARRGISTRALALLTQQSDFDVAVTPPRNRHAPTAKWSRAVMFDR